jgi:SAM-dependent methyltransferase
VKEVPVDRRRIFPPVSLSADALRNRAAWTKANADRADRRARTQWSREEVYWGLWHIPESELNVLGEIEGLDIVELGCGTAFFGASLARRGARVVGVDVTLAQLSTARRLQRETGLQLELVLASAEHVPVADGSFDIALSEYGASVWCDPAVWIPEAARLLRPGGRLIFLNDSPLAIMCSPNDGPADQRLHRPQFGTHRIAPSGEEGVEYHPAHGEWIAILRANAFDVEALFELRAPPDARDDADYPYVSAEWARKWPSEEIWVARRR